MGLTPDHPGFVRDPPDVVADRDALRCPTLVTLAAAAAAAAASPGEREGMVPFRQGLADHLVHNRGGVRVEWRPFGHMMVLSDPEQTSDLITGFVHDSTGRSR